jgi:hypothetical protein
MPNEPVEIDRNSQAIIRDRMFINIHKVASAVVSRPVITPTDIVDER